NPHEKLRLTMRKQMREPGLPRRAQKRLVPNTYVVPTSKKRESLRFSVRRDLANYLMPSRN
ncbi:HYLS1 protein, partial [Sapayoa aenigma]|nr:HYLS1 protein [Sapayoa aenigma]